MSKLTNFYEQKRRGVTSGRIWLFQEYSNETQKYLDEFYNPEDYQIIMNFFYENPLQARTIVEDFNRSDRQKIEIVMKEIIEGKSKLIYIVGGRGSGKTADVFYFVERLNKEEDKEIFYIIPERPKGLPKWCKIEEDIKNTPTGSVNIVDEAAIQFSARESWKEQNILLGKMMAISRHQNKTMFFLTQHTMLIDVNIRRMRDIILWKMQADYSLQEGKYISREQQFWSMIRNFMKPHMPEQTLFEYPMKRRFILFQHPLPECWSEQLSKSWKNIDWSKMEREKKPRERQQEEDIEIV